MMKVMTETPMDRACQDATETGNPDPRRSEAAKARNEAFAEAIAILFDLRKKYVAGSAAWGAINVAMGDIETRRRGGK